MKLQNPNKKQKCGAAFTRAQIGRQIITNDSTFESEAIRYARTAHLPHYPLLRFTGLLKF
jgi:hypothetical protein